MYILLWIEIVAAPIATISTKNTKKHEKTLPGKYPSSSNVI
jgi:hypothetical protein